MLQNLNSKLTSIPFSSFEMVEKANGEPVVMLEIFKLLKCHPKSKNDDLHIYNTEIIMIVNNQLFIKQNGKDQVDVFVNDIFNHLEEDSHFLLFIDNGSLIDNTSFLKDQVRNLLLSMDRKWVELLHLEGSISGFLVDKVIETELGEGKRDELKTI
ncbi:hypothetical protein [Enterococcus sp. RIT-PI-f]|uniref:hypothetical protein n=1 Tax=Enterococcus sp. RIT-PI-f TaxID=1690244 RepID=UPI0006B9886D|nr:hypothetical protein [Enterococcus sp. RIT-PI-f]KPG72015.1 hypothetical protein AEQ18_02925 [Enterococcus sp. RIT-PI-f]